MEQPAWRLRYYRASAVKAVNAAYLALAAFGTHRVSLDKLIETMPQTGADMQANYRETSRRGRAMNVPEC